MLTDPTALGVGRWSPRAPDAAGRVVVAAPHPDDEVLGLGMTMRWLADRGHEVTVVACTDGEGSHARSTAISADGLRSARARERTAAFAVLGIAPTVHRLALPDGGLAGRVHDLATSLAGLAGHDTTLVVPWAHDGHPDHEAVAAAGALVAARTGTSLWQVPIWGKVRARRRVTGRVTGRVSRLRLTVEARRCKAAAAAAFATQLLPVGPGAQDGPVVHPGELERMLDGEEVVLW